MALSFPLNTKRPERIWGEKEPEIPTTNKEIYLLRALLNLLLYTGIETGMGDREGKGLFFMSGETRPNRLPFNMPITLG